MNRRDMLAGMFGVPAVMILSRCSRVAAEEAPHIAKGIAKGVGNGTLREVQGRRY